ncbi:hypothetical protein DXG01_012917 [Tephrocybe rancida]|nr:hypothetical protein DXG01_012917 [Tephrocybe rancida]
MVLVRTPPLTPISPPNGFPQDYLEESLTELFSVRAGFLRLCFRHKSNGPVYFVEFEDVPYATKALNELHGDTLKGLVKGGIRLSYSKNPLGNPAAMLASNSSGQEFQSRIDEQQQSRVPQMILRRDIPLASLQLTSVQAFAPELLGTSPPPRFFSSSPNGFATSTGPNLTNASKFPSSMPRYTFGMPTNTNHGQPSSFSPFGLENTPPPPHSTITDLHPDGHLASSHSQHFHNNFAPVTNLEAAGPVEKRSISKRISSKFQYLISSAQT